MKWPNVKIKRQCHKVKIVGGAQDTALVCIGGCHYPVLKGDTMIADSGCSCHLVGNGEFLEEIEEIHRSISGIGARQMLAVKKGKMC